MRTPDGVDAAGEFDALAKKVDASSNYRTLAVVLAPWPAWGLVRLSTDVFGFGTNATTLLVIAVLIVAVAFFLRFRASSLRKQRSLVASICSRYNLSPKEAVVLLASEPTEKRQQFVEFAWGAEGAAVVKKELDSRRAMEEQRRKAGAVERAREAVLSLAKEKVPGKELVVVAAAYWSTTGSHIKSEVSQAVLGGLLSTTVFEIGMIAATRDELFWIDVGTGGGDPVWALIDIAEHSRWKLKDAKVTGAPLSALGAVIEASGKLSVHGALSFSVGVVDSFDTQNVERAQQIAALISQKKVVVK